MALRTHSPPYYERLRTWSDTRPGNTIMMTRIAETGEDGHRFFRSSAIIQQNPEVRGYPSQLNTKLASSVRAIRRSLENRRDRLVALRDEVQANPDLLEAARGPRTPLGDLLEDAPEHQRWEAEEQALRLTVARNLDELAAAALRVEEAGPERKHWQNDSSPSWERTPSTTCTERPVIPPFCPRPGPRPYPDDQGVAWPDARFQIPPPA